MGSPAARLTDRTAHGGMIVLGKLNVWISYRPAARLGDPHVCPPGHYFGPIMPPCAYNVLIGGKPAARIGDKLVCGCGTPDVITSGEQKVLIGTDGQSSDPGLAAMQQVALQSAAGLVAGWSFFGEPEATAPGDRWTEQGIRDILSQTPSGREALARMAPGTRFGTREVPGMGAFYEPSTRTIHIPANTTNEQAANYAAHEIVHTDQYRNFDPAVARLPVAQWPAAQQRQAVENEVEAWNFQIRNWEERGRPDLPADIGSVARIRSSQGQRAFDNAIRDAYRQVYGVR
jgi:uncharacterized Zn-binding protein involved in type VI secretion